MCIDMPKTLFTCWHPQVFVPGEGLASEVAAAAGMLTLSADLLFTERTIEQVPFSPHTAPMHLCFPMLSVGQCSSPRYRTSAAPGRSWWECLVARADRDRL